MFRCRWLLTTHCESPTQPAPKRRPGHSPGRRGRSVSLRAAAQTTRRSLGARKRLSPPAPPVVYLCHSLSPDESEKKKHHRTWLSCVSVHRCCYCPPWWLLSASAPRVRTRPGGSRSGSFLTPKRSASRRANTEGSASATTRASAPGATRERPASMVMSQNLPFKCIQRVIFWKERI